MNIYVKHNNDPLRPLKVNVFDSLSLRKVSTTEVLDLFHAVMRDRSSFARGQRTFTIIFDDPEQTQTQSYRQNTETRRERQTSSRMFNSDKAETTPMLPPPEEPPFEEELDFRQDVSRRDITLEERFVDKGEEQVLSPAVKDSVEELCEELHRADPSADEELQANAKNNPDKTSQAKSNSDPAQSLKQSAQKLNDSVLRDISPSAKENIGQKESARLPTEQMLQKSENAPRSVALLQMILQSMNGANTSQMTPEQASGQLTQVLNQLLAGLKESKLFSSSKQSEEWALHLMSLLGKDLNKSDGFRSNISTLTKQLNCLTQLLSLFGKEALMDCLVKMSQRPGEKTDFESLLLKRLESVLNMISNSLLNSFKSFSSEISFAMIYNQLMARAEDKQALLVCLKMLQMLPKERRDLALKLLDPSIAALITRIPELQRQINNLPSSSKGMIKDSSKTASTPTDNLISIPVKGKGVLLGDLQIPPRAQGIVVFTRGSSGFGPSDEWMALAMQKEGIGTLLIDLLTEEEIEEEEKNASRFDTDFLRDRLGVVAQWLKSSKETRLLSVGYFGADKGAAVVLHSAAELDSEIAAVVSRGSNLDLESSNLNNVKAPTLFIVEENDPSEMIFQELNCDKKKVVVSETSSLLAKKEEDKEVSRIMLDWFSLHFRNPA